MKTGQQKINDSVLLALKQCHSLSAMLTKPSYAGNDGLHASVDKMAPHYPSVTISIKSMMASKLNQKRKCCRSFTLAEKHAQIIQVPYFPSSAHNKIDNDCFTEVLPFP